MKQAWMRTSLAALLALATAGSALAADLRVLSSGGYTAAYQKVAPQVDAATHNVTHQEFGASMGQSTSSIPSRLKRGEDDDLVIMVDYALDDLIKAGLVDPATRTALARSSVAMAVKAGAPKPDISSMAAFKQTLLNAKSIGYSDSASGVYLTNTLFPKMGIAEQLKPKLHLVAAPVMVGEPIAKGELDIGFQQLSELRSVPGVDIVGTIPADAQIITTYAAGVVKTSKHPTEAMAVIRYLQTDPSAAAVVARTGLDPIR